MGDTIGSKLLEGEEARVETFSALTPEQREIMKEVYQYLSGKVGQGATPWGPTGYPKEGEQYYAAGLTPGEEEAVAYLSQYLSGGPTPYYAGALQKAVSGLSPEAATAQWRGSVYPEARRIFEQETLPAVRESYIGSGLLRSEPRARGEAEAQERFGNAAALSHQQWLQDAHNRAAGLLPTAIAAEQLPMTRALAAMQAVGLGRQLRQAEINARLEEFKRTQPEYSPLLERAMAFIGLPAQGAYGIPYQPSPWAAVAGAAAGAYAGGMA